MNYIAFDTTMKNLIVTAEIDGQVLSHNDSLPLQHTVTLLPSIDKLAQGKPDNIDVFACNIGPGSFTGIRIGVTTLKTLAYALCKNIVAFNTFEVLAYNIIDTFIDKCILIADGGNRTCYTAIFDRKDNKIDGMQNLTLPETGEYLAKHKYPYVALSDINGLITDNIRLKTGEIAEGIRKLVTAKIERKEFADFNTLEPLYLQLSQAEKERQKHD